MFLTVHAVAGELFAQTTSQPWLAFMIGFFSHIPFDIIPHGDEHIGESIHGSRTRRLIEVTLIDLVIMSIVQIVLLASDILPMNFTILLGGFGAIVPDALQVPVLAFKNPPKIFILYKRWHDFFHGIVDASIGTTRGLVLQTMTLIVLVILL